MDIFEIVTITLSFVVGLGMTQMLASVVGVIRTRKERSVHWLPLAWAASIFMFHVLYWFAIYSVNQVVDAWTWGIFSAVLLLAGLLFLSGGLILPSESSRRSGSLEEDFREHGRLSLPLLAAHLLIYVPINLRVRGDTLYSLGNLPIYALVALIAISFISKRPRVQTISFCMFAAIQAYATLFSWAPEALG